MAGAGFIDIAQGIGAAGRALEPMARDYLAQEAQKARDDRLAELQDVRDARMDERAKAREIDAERRKLEPGKRAAEKASVLIAERTAAMNPVLAENADGTTTPAATVSEREQAAIRAEALAGEGLVNEAMHARQEVRDIDRLGLDTKRHQETLAQAKELATMTDTRIKEEGKLTREHQERLHRERMAEMQAQFKNQGLSIQSTTDGMVLIDAKINKATPIMVDGKQLKQLKEDDSLKLITALGSMAKASAEIGDNDSAKIYLEIAKSAIGMKTGTTTGGKNGWDPNTKNVYRNGEVIGTADNEKAGRDLFNKKVVPEPPQKPVGGTSGSHPAEGAPQADKRGSNTSYFDKQAKIRQKRNSLNYPGVSEAAKARIQLEIAELEGQFGDGVPLSMRR